MTQTEKYIQHHYLTATPERMADCLNINIKSVRNVMYANKWEPYVRPQEEEFTGLFDWSIAEELDPVILSHR